MVSRRDGLLREWRQRWRHSEMVEGVEEEEVVAATTHARKEEGEDAARWGEKGETARMGEERTGG
uniref:Uncharacterized protein n=1 Tax=Oryza sativa subsp. japonica TaxID=39947 RepID=Q67TV2_ORYSJ|nr:hypothetical protein [Oryza sativa Japonica Group]